MGYKESQANHVPGISLEYECSIARAVSTTSHLDDIYMYNMLEPRAIVSRRKIPSA